MYTVQLAYWCFYLNHVVQKLFFIFPTYLQLSLRAPMTHMHWCIEGGYFRSHSEEPSNLRTIGACMHNCMHGNHLCNVFWQKFSMHRVGAGRNMFSLRRAVSKFTTVFTTILLQFYYSLQFTIVLLMFSNSILHFNMVYYSFNTVSLQPYCSLLKFYNSFNTVYLWN